MKRFLCFGKARRFREMKEIGPFALQLLIDVRTPALLLCILRFFVEICFRLIEAAANHADHTRTAPSLVS